MFKGKRIIVGVTGGIAAYKAADLVSKLSQRGAEVYVLMTAAAQEFVSPLTFRALSHNPVYTDMFDSGDGPYVPHIDIATQANLMMIVPATAHTIARLAYGMADDFISTVALATRAPILVAPSMNVHMYGHTAVQNNIKHLQNLGYHVVAPEEGNLACGTSGAGRLPGTDVLLKAAEEILCCLKSDLKGKTVLVTAGGTREAIDPVRFIGNRSSGKMGYSLAAAARDRGAQVILVSGVAEQDPPGGVEIQRVESVDEMYREVMRSFDRADVVIKAAAVSDYRPVETAPQKIKKKSEILTLELQKTQDILKELGRKKTDQILVGFAAETGELEANALSKLREKNLDLIVANNVTREGSGFGSDTNIVTLIWRDGRIQGLEKMAKREVAHRILDAVSNLIDERRFPSNREEE